MWRLWPVMAGPNVKSIFSGFWLLFWQGRQRFYSKWKGQWRGVGAYGKDTSLVHWAQSSWAPGVSRDIFGRGLASMFSYWGNIDFMQLQRKQNTHLVTASFIKVWSCWSTSSCTLFLFHHWRLCAAYMQATCWQCCKSGTWWDILQLLQ